MQSGPSFGYNGDAGWNFNRCALALVQRTLTFRAYPFEKDQRGIGLALDEHRDGIVLAIHAISICDTIYTKSISF